jgi:hypothetical protein
MQANFFQRPSAAQPQVKKHRRKKENIQIGGSFISLKAALVSKSGCWGAPGIGSDDSAYCSTPHVCPPWIDKEDPPWFVHASSTVFVTDQVPRHRIDRYLCCVHFVFFFFFLHMVRFERGYCFFMRSCRIYSSRQLETLSAMFEQSVSCSTPIDPMCR